MRLHQHRPGAEALPGVIITRSPRDKVAGNWDRTQFKLQTAAQTVHGLFDLLHYESHAGNFPYWINRIVKFVYDSYGCMTVQPSINPQVEGERGKRRRGSESLYRSIHSNLRVGSFRESRVHWVGAEPVVGRLAGRFITGKTLPRSELEISLFTCSINITGKVPVGRALVAAERYA
jgi:hypothetical protein